MTKEEKSLLLTDLCARLPYGVKCNAVLKQMDGSLKSVFGKFKGYNGWANIGDNLVDIKTVKPYLRPMSSMTKDEEKELGNYLSTEVFLSIDGLHSVLRAQRHTSNFLYSRHLDILGLIEKGLALPASKDMYK